jgi:hypothetical protein
MDTFVDIPNIHNAEINRLGVVRKKSTGYIYHHCIGNGYYHVNINHKALKMSRLMAITFITNPDNKPIVDHIDQNKLNDSLDNLRWVTKAENQQNHIRVMSATHISFLRGGYQVQYQCDTIIYRKWFKNEDDAHVYLAEIKHVNPHINM